LVETSEGETANHVGAAVRLLAKKPSAVVCHNDYRALILEEAALARGLRVPQDLSIIGMDDIPEAQAHGLSTMSIDFSEVGRRGVEALLQQVAGASAAEASRRIPTALVERRSVDDGPRLKYLG
jgi:LacI family transcriptional regulator